MAEATIDARMPVGDTQGATMQQLRIALHDLCQPLTTLQCRLEMAELVGTAEAFAEAVSLGLVECARISQAVAEMRASVCRAPQSGASADSKDTQDSERMER
jgi:hypothetical protein